MATCIRCGEEHYDGRICDKCMKKWTDMRQISFEMAEKEFGKLCAGNHEQIKKRVKQIERDMKKANANIIK